MQGVSEAASPAAETGFGARLRQARLVKGLSRRQVATLVGVHEKTVAKWEQDRMVPHERHIFKLAGELGVRPVWLFDGIGTMFGGRRPR